MKKNIIELLNDIKEDNLNEEMLNVIVENSEIIENHKYNINKMNGKDSRWRTTIKKKEKGLKAISAKTKGELYVKLVNHYKEMETNATFRECYKKYYVASEAEEKSTGTLCKYESSYKRYFSNTFLENMNIKDITDRDITKALIECRDKYDLHKKALEEMFGLIKAICEEAFFEKLISENPCKHVNIKRIKKVCKERVKSNTAKERILNAKELKDLGALIKKLKETDKYLYAYMLEYCVNIGCRIGEVTVLSREDFDFEENILYIRHQEIVDRHKNPDGSNNKYRYVSRDVPYTKTDRVREFPITQRLKELYEEVEAIKAQKGIDSEYLFYDMDSHTFVSKVVLGHYISDNDLPSIHKNRRTLASNLHVKGIPPKAVSALLGHSEIVDKNNYLYDATDIEIKRNALNLINPSYAA